MPLIKKQIPLNCLGEKYMKFKNQHWVPQCYLNYWCDNNIPERHDPYVWIISKNWSIQKPKSPKKILSESQLYTIYKPNGERDLSIEIGLSQLENDYKQVVSKITKNKPINLNDIEILCTFVAAMHERTPFQRDHLKAQWGEVYAKMERMRIEIEGATPEKRAQMGKIGPTSDGPTFSMSDVQRFAETPLQTMMVPRVKVLSSILKQMNLLILRSTKGLFLSSDNPSILFDPESNKRPFMSRGGIGYETAEITLPITPNHTLLFTWTNPPYSYLDLTEREVDILNKRIWYFANDYVIANSKLDKPLWLSD